MRPMPPPGEPVPPSLAWIGLAVTGLAAVAGGLSSQVHGLAAGDVGGGFGLSADEASWITTAGSAAEGAAVIAGAPLAAAFGTRRVLQTALVLVGALALAVHAWSGPALAVPLRFAEGFCAGLLPVLMMGWSMRAFPPVRRGLPLMLFAYASSAPTALAALVAGFVTGHLGGRGAFLWDVLWTPLVLLVAVLLMPREPVALARLRQVDWVGYMLTASAAMLALTLLSQGERRFWLETPWFPPLVAAALAAGALALIWLLIAREPLLDLGLLRQPTFAIGLAEAFSLRFGLLLASFAVPQALAHLHGFRVEQAGQAVLWMGLGQVVGFPLAYLWVRRRDGRWALAGGLALFAGAALWAALIDPSWEGDQFRQSLVAAGFGQGLYLTSVMTFATWHVPAQEGQTAAGLFNLTRVLGTAAATAAVGYGLRIRENGHSARLVEGVRDGNQAAVERLSDLTQSYAALTPDAGIAQSQAVGALASSISTQAYALAFADVFVGIAAILGVFALLVPLLPRIAPFLEERPVETRP